MKITDDVEIVFTNSKGDNMSLIISVKQLLDKTSDDLYDMLEDQSPCNSSGCNNESQNFCDCGTQYDDFEITEVLPIK